MTTALPAAPPVPSSETAEAEFDAAFEAFLSWLANQLVPGFNAALPNIDAANTSAVAAVAAAAYKGPWASLAGALAIPASVSYNNVVWVLTESVANVAAEVPGVSTKWIAVSGAPVLELISTTNATAAATVEWTNFDTLAAMYSALRIVADGIVGSSATADLKGDLRQNGAWITDGTSLYLNATDFGGSQPGGTLFAGGGLKSVGAQSITLDMDITGLGRIARPNVRFASMGGTHSGASSATVSMIGSVTSAKAWVPTTALQGLRIYASTGNISGTFRLYGVRK